MVFSARSIFIRIFVAMKTTIRFLLLTTVLTLCSIFKIGTIRAQIFGAEARMLPSDHSFGGSLEFGRRYGFGDIYFQVSILDRLLHYTQTYSGFPPTQDVSSEYIQWMPAGVDASFSIEPCFKLLENLYVGPTFGITSINEHGIDAIKTGFFYQHFVEYRPGVYYGDDWGTFANGAKYVRPFIFGNFGGAVKVAISPAILLSVDYGSQSGIGAGLDMTI